MNWKVIIGYVISLGGKAVAGYYGVEIDEKDVVEITNSTTAVVAAGISLVPDAIAAFKKLRDFIKGIRAKIKAKSA